MYNFIEVCFCDYYAERLLDDLITDNFIDEKLVVYLHKVEYLLFEKEKSDPKFFECDDNKFYDFISKLIQDLIPSKNDYLFIFNIK